MRLKHEIRQVEAPHTLVLSNSSTQEIDDILQKKTAESVSPETLSYRLQQGWQHLQEFPDPVLNNNNSAERPLPADPNDNSGGGPGDPPAPPPDTASAALQDETYRREAMTSDDDSGSSSEEESSTAFSDTNPLLDVSSLGDSEISSDSDMSEDSSSSSSSSSSSGSDRPAANNNNDDQQDQEEEDEEEEEEGEEEGEAGRSMQSSWMSFSSAASSPSDPPAPLPDVLPVGRARDDDEPMSEGSGSREPERRPAQPDLQVALRLKHGNTYPREAKSHRRGHLKSRREATWIVNDSFEEDSATTSPRYWALGEGVRLNNFTIVNGFKSLTELDNADRHRPDKDWAVPKTEPTKSEPTKAETRFPFHESRPSDAGHDFERNYSRRQADARLCCKDNRRFQKGAPQDPAPPAPPPQKQVEGPRSLADHDDNCNSVAAAAAPRPGPGAAGKPEDGKLSSPELFDVYTMETAIPHINWAAIGKAGRESDWIRKRRNDREEIRRKLAMDSDTEDYITEKLTQHRENDSSFSRLKGSGNLQICFMNEAAKDQDLPPVSNSSDGDPFLHKSKPSLPKIQIQTSQSPSSNLSKCDKATSKTTASSAALSVTKRQRPKFFFNRPRSWHASKPEQKPFPEEDLLTRHTRLQAEAKEALAQAKDMARMQMEIERQKKKKSPIAEMVGLPFPDGRNSLSHHALVSMNVAQLQVIVNDLHSQIETLNEDLVKFLLERDDLHMEQDSKLVDIEDLTRYLGLKGTNGVSTSSSQASTSTPNNKQVERRESVKRSQSVHLKSKNLM